MMTIQITNRCPDLQLPQKASSGAAGFDLRAAVDAPVVIGPGSRSLVPTGISIAIPSGFEGQVRPRSGLAIKHGISLVNTPGTIDSDYRGEISVILINHGDVEFTIQRGDRIAQLVVCAVPESSLVEVETLPDTARGTGGFGSSGSS